MTKKARMTLLILAATAFNIVLTIICFTVLMLLYTVFFVSHVPDNIQVIGFPVIFLGSIVITFMIYQKVLKLFLKKYPVA